MVYRHVRENCPSVLKTPKEEENQYLCDRCGKTFKLKWILDKYE
jgi:hypothetical protein